MSDTPRILRPDPPAPVHRITITESEGLTLVPLLSRFAERLSRQWRPAHQQVGEAERQALAVAFVAELDAPADLRRVFSRPYEVVMVPDGSHALEALAAARCVPLGVQIVERPPFAIPPGTLLS